MALQPTAMPTEGELKALDPKDNPDDKMKGGQDMVSAPGATSMPSGADEASAFDPNDNPQDVMDEAQSLGGGMPSQASTPTPTPTPGKGSSEEEDANQNKRSPMEEWVKEILQRSETCKPSDSETSSASPMKAEGGQYNKIAEQNNTPDAGSGSPALAEEATEVVAENPELLAGI